MTKKIYMKANHSPKQNIEIIVNNVYSKIIGLKNKTIIDALDRQLSYFVQGANFSAAYKTGWWDNKQKKWRKWDGFNRLLSKDHKFLTGLLERVTSILKNHSVDYKITDHRKEVPFRKKIKTKNIEPREYQKRVLDNCMKHRGGLVASATGSGKTVMMVELVANTNVKTMIYVIGIDLLYQTKAAFEKMLGTRVGMIGDGHADVQRINICTCWTASRALGKKYVSFDDEDRSPKEKFDDSNKAEIVRAIKTSEMYIVDECQVLGTETLNTINKASASARYKFGFSGTPYRSDNSDLLLEAVCGKIICEVTSSELINSGYLVKPKIQFVSVPAYGGSSTTYQSIYKEYIVENDIRNTKIIKIAAKLVEAKRKVLILVKNIKHGKILAEEAQKLNIGTYFVSGIVDSDTRNEIKQKFVDGTIDLMIASVIFDTGIDIPSLDALILAGGGKSKGRTIQRIGRVLRPAPGKKDAIVVDFLDNAKYLVDHSIARLDAYREESGFQIKLPKDFEQTKKRKNAGWKKQRFEKW